MNSFSRIKNGFVDEKLSTILSNSLKAAIEKELKKACLEYELSYENHYLLDREVLFSLKIQLTEWASGIIKVGRHFDLKKFKKLLTVAKESGQNRIDDFEQICCDERLDYSLLFNGESVFVKTEENLKEIGEGLFGILHGEAYPAKMTFTLLFFEKHQITLKVYYYEAEDFIEKIKDFCAECKGKKYDSLTFKKAYKESTLYEYRIIPENEEMFTGNYNVEHVILCAELNKIPDTLFKDCKNLKSVRIPESIETIGSKAFYGCKKLEKINIPKRLKKIETQAFAHCDNLYGIEIPKKCQVAVDAFLNNFDDDYYESYTEYDDMDSEMRRYYGDPANWY